MLSTESIQGNNTMHNILSHNQMTSWSHSYSTFAISQDDEKLDDYYECLIECEDDQSACNRVCREILTESV